MIKEEKKLLQWHEDSHRIWHEMEMKSIRGEEIRKEQAALDKYVQSGKAKKDAKMAFDKTFKNE